MAGKESGYRNRLFRALHAEAPKRRIDHDGLHTIVCERFRLHSMAEASDAQLEAVYREWTGKTLKRRAALPRAGETRSSAAAAQIVSAAEVEDLAAEFSRAGMGQEARKNFVRRQLGGRSEVRTRGDWGRVIGGLRAMRKRREAGGDRKTGEVVVPGGARAADVAGAGRVSVPEVSSQIPGSVAE